MRKLLSLICLAISACNTPPTETALSLKEVKFPDVEFSRFIAENGIRRTEGKELSSNLDAKSTKKYDSMGRIIFTSYGSFMPTTEEITYDSNGMIAETYRGSCAYTRSITKYQVDPKLRMLKETIFWLQDWRALEIDTVASKWRNHLIDSYNRITAAAEYRKPDEYGKNNNLTLTLFSYTESGNIRLSQVYNVHYPSLKHIENGDPYKTITAYFYKGSKPVSSISKNFYGKAKRATIAGSSVIKALYDEHGLLSRLIFDDTLMVGYQHFTN